MIGMVDESNHIGSDDRTVFRMGGDQRTAAPDGKDRFRYVFEHNTEPVGTC